MLTVKVLPGLPTYGPLATAFPEEWGRLGREGVVVEFTTGVGTWAGNFRPGLGGIDFVAPHPDGRQAVVVSAGDLWIVDPDARTAEHMLPAVFDAFEVHNPDGWVFNRQGIALARLGPDGLLWHTRRLSWDGFDQLKIVDGEITGRAWAPHDDKWHPFRVDLQTGNSIGGTYDGPDADKWEKLL